jgi:hypothetical protein
MQSTNHAYAYPASHRAGCERLAAGTAACTKLTVVLQQIEPACDCPEDINGKLCYIIRAAQFAAVLCTVCINPSRLAVTLLTLQHCSHAITPDLQRTVFAHLGCDACRQQPWLPLDGHACEAACLIQLHSAGHQPGTHGLCCHEEVRRCAVWA